MSLKAKMIAVEPDEAEDMIGKLRRTQQLFIGPRGGRWADSQHTISFDDTPGKARLRTPDLSDDYEMGRNKRKALIKRGMNLHQAEEAIRRAGIEHGVAFGRDGEQLFRAVGNKRSVDIAPRNVRRARKHGAAVFTHNHPGTDGAMLSHNDIVWAVRHNLKEVRAVSVIGTYSLKRPPGGWGVHADRNDFGVWAVGNDSDDDDDNLNLHAWLSLLQSIAIAEARVHTINEVGEGTENEDEDAEIEQGVFEYYMRSISQRIFNQAFSGEFVPYKGFGYRSGPAARKTKGWKITFTPAARTDRTARSKVRREAGRSPHPHVPGTAFAKVRSKMSKALPEIRDCVRCNGPMLGKAGPTCGCSDKSSKRRLPMIGKADEAFDEMPAELRALISQLPFEVQASELGGAGSTDIRPTMLEANYEMPSRHPGSCVTCDHARHESVLLGGVSIRSLACSALATQPPVAASARCDLWTGRDQILIGKASNGGGPTVPFGVQRLPDYQEVYGITPEEDEARLLAAHEENRRQSNRDRNTGRYGFHGQPPEPHLRNEAMQHTPHMARPLGRMDNKPQVMAPLIFKRQPASERERLVKRPAGLPLGGETEETARASKKG